MEEMKVGKYTIKSTVEEKKHKSYVEFESSVHTHLKLKGIVEYNGRYIIVKNKFKHILLKNWPEHGAPNYDTLFLELLENLREYMILVHSSAGNKYNNFK